jgi:hypothetical protein|tara:strand:+ start:493 stop:861 length:369 start_codon:yes stop_codon:yes gene_type:complete
MATNASWTVVFDDKLVIKNNGAEAGTGYIISDNDFWGLAKWNNIWAIQYGTSNPSDTVEYRDTTPHSTWEDANLGDFSDFIDKWDAVHLSQLQANWDDDNVDDETEEDKIARLGARPTSYSS